MIGGQRQRQPDQQPGQHRENQVEHQAGRRGARRRDRRIAQRRQIGRGARRQGEQLRVRRLEGRKAALERGQEELLLGSQAGEGGQGICPRLCVGDLDLRVLQALVDEGLGLGIPTRDRRRRGDRILGDGVGQLRGLGRRGVRDGDLHETAVGWRNRRHVLLELLKVEVEAEPLDDPFERRPLRGDGCIGLREALPQERLVETGREGSRRVADDQRRASLVRLRPDEAEEQRRRHRDHQCRQHDPVALADEVAEAAQIHGYISEGGLRV